MQRVSGVDGCRQGWVILTEDLNTGEITWHLRESSHELVYSVPPSIVTAVDMPIGLPSLGARTCDREARQRFGWPRSSSVFPAPIRPVLEAETYEEACDIRFDCEGKKLSKQAWGIVPKIRELDEAPRQDPALQRRVREVHPEVTCCFLVGERPMQHSKKKKGANFAAEAKPAQRREIFRALQMEITLSYAEADEENEEGQPGLTYVVF